VGPRDDYLLGRLLESQAAGGQELVLTRSDVEKLESADAPQFPDARWAMAVLAATDASALAHGNFRV